MVDIGGLKTRFSANQWVPYQNKSGEQIPPHAVLMITGLSSVNDELFLDAEKPDGSSVSWYAVNGPAAVDNNGFGDCTFDPSVVVRYESGTPANGDDWGPESGNWGITSGGSNFYIYGIRTNTRELNLVEAVQVSAGATLPTSHFADLLNLSFQTESEQSPSPAFVALEFDDTDIIGVGVTADTTNNKFTTSETGKYWVSLYFQAKCTNASNSSWAEVSTIDVEFREPGSDVDMGELSIKGTSTEEPFSNYFNGRFVNIVTATSDYSFQVKVTGEDVEIHNTKATIWRLYNT